MGQLIRVEEFQPRNRDDIRSRADRNPTWYFADTIWSSSRHQFTVASSYPVALYVHQSTLDTAQYGEDERKKAAQRRIAIRRWIERSLVGDVILEYVNLAYYRVYGSSRNNVTTVEHGYRKFSFETEAEAFAFRMQFDFALTEMNSRHPQVPPEDFEYAWDFDLRREADEFAFQRRYGSVK